jgi:hypothetical protein
MRLGLKLAVLRSGQTQRQVGATAGISEARLSSIIRGWTTPRDDERRALEQCLHVGAEAFEVDRRPRPR